MANTVDDRPQILVIDDDDDTRATLCMVLEPEGYEVAEAPNGARALEMLREGMRPGLILLDLMMPVVNGWEFREQQLADPALADIPVVVFSAYADVQRTEAMGADAYLKKPLGLDTLLSAVRCHTSRRR
jgi:CheY-like chemotaxis protein